MGANVALGTYSHDKDPRLLEQALREARAMAGLGLPATVALSTHVEGIVSYLRGDAIGAEASLRLAEQYCRRHQASVSELYSRRARAFVMGGRRGRLLLDETAQALTDQGVADVERWSAMKLPGFSR